MFQKCRDVTEVWIDRQPIAEVGPHVARTFAELGAGAYLKPPHYIFGLSVTLCCVNSTQCQQMRFMCPDQPPCSGEIRYPLL